MFIPCTYCDNCYTVWELEWCEWCGDSGWIEDNNEVSEMGWETILEHPIPCKVDGKPAFILGYGCEGGRPVVDYRYADGSGAHWRYCDTGGITDLPEQHDWHVDYHYRLIRLTRPEDVTLREPTKRPFKHVHNWCPTDNYLIDRCSVCGEERA